MIPTLQTRRLTLLPLTLADANQTQRLFPQWEIVRFLANRFPWPYPPDGAHTYYRDDAIPAMLRGDEWHWTLRLNSDPTHHIGCIALTKSESAGNRGFWLGLPWHHQGLMTEAVDAVTDFWFSTLNFPEMRVTKAIANSASRRISEKNGMRILSREDREYISGRFPSETWTITAEEWRRHRAATS